MFKDIPEFDLICAFLKGKNERYTLMGERARKELDELEGEIDPSKIKSFEEKLNKERALAHECQSKVKLYGTVLTALNKINDRQFELSGSEFARLAKFLCTSEEVKRIDPEGKIHHVFLSVARFTIVRVKPENRSSAPKLR